MDTRTLGRTDLQVSRLGLGGLFVASFATELDQAKGALKRAVELGVNYIDTAPGYANSEEVLGKALAGVDAPLVISTKLGGRPDPFDPRDAKALHASVKESLRLLGRDCIDILMIHEPDRPAQYDWWTDYQDVTGPVLEVMHELQSAGTVRYLGLGGTTTTEIVHLIRSGKFDVVLTAFNYSLLWREAAIEVIPAAKEMKMGIIAGSPLQQGALARCYTDTVAHRPHWLSKPRWQQLKQLYAFVDQCGMSLPELAIRFVISNPDVDCTLMGTRNATEVEQNAAAVEKGPLPGDILKRLDDIAATVPFRPFEEPFGMGWILGNPDGYKGPATA